jgi:MFS family permease
VARSIIILALLTFGNFFNIVDKNVMSLFMPLIRHDIPLSDTVAGFIIGPAFVLAAAVVALPISRLADARGPRLIIGASLLVWSAATIFVGSAGTMIALIIARMTVGAGESGYQPATNATLATIFSRRNLGRALSVFAFGAGVAQVFGFYASSLFNEQLGWRGTFHLLGAAGLVLAVIIFFAWPMLVAPHPKVERDAPPRLAFFPTLAMLFRIPAFGFLLLGAVVHAVAAYSAGQWMPTFLQTQHGLSLKETGLWIGLVFSVGSIAGNVGTGFVVDRWKTGKLVRCLRLCAFTSILATPFYLMGYLATSVSIITFLPAYILAAVYLAPTYLVLQNLVPAEHRATANAVVITLFNVVGLGLGPVISGAGSDFFKAMGFSNNLGLAMSVGASLNLISAGFYFMAERRLRQSPEMRDL